MKWRLGFVFVTVLLGLACGSKEAPTVRAEKAPSVAASNAGAPEQGFWTWFQSSDERLFALEDEQLVGDPQLATEIKRVHPDLIVEVSVEKVDGKRQLVISADGHLAAFPAVERLVRAAPSLKRWTLVAFRQRTSEPQSMKIKMDGVELNADQVTYRSSAQGDKLGLTIYVPGYRPDSETLAMLVYIFLDHIVGEYDVETRIGTIDIQAPPATGATQAQPLAALQAELDRLKTK